MKYLSQVVVDRPRRTADDRIPTRWSHRQPYDDGHGLSVLGWGVGGIDGEAAMPAGRSRCRSGGRRGPLTGGMAEGATATDLVLTITQMLRDAGVVGALSILRRGLPSWRWPSATNRATCPGIGCDCGFFPIDAENRYLTLTARDRPGQIGRAPMPRPRAVARSQHARPGLHRSDGARSRHRRAVRSPGRAGPQDGLSLAAAGKGFDEELPRLAGSNVPRTQKVEGSN